MKKKTADRMPFDENTSRAHSMELAPKKSLRPEKTDMTPDAEKDDQMLIRKFREGGAVRGCKSMQSSGKSFAGTY